MKLAYKIIDCNKDNKFYILQENLQIVSESLKEYYIPVTIVGRNRSGKSYFMNVLRRKLLNKDKDGPLCGFETKYGNDAVTRGYWTMACNLETEKDSFLLCDTEGAYEIGKDQKMCSKMFAISALLSSCFIVNIKSKIDEDELSFIERFFENLIENSEKNVELNTLVFLIRDWPFPQEYNFGLEGGQKYITKVMESKKSLKKFTNMFKSSYGFLMPSIGTEQIEDQKYCDHYDKAGVRPKFDKYCEEFLKNVLLKIPKAHDSKNLSKRFTTIIEMINQEEYIDISKLWEALETIGSFILVGAVIAAGIAGGTVVVGGLAVCAFAIMKLL